jgi:hypothetical protein
VWKLAWDFFLSLAIRGVFTLVLVGGADFLAWTYHSWRTGFWKDEPHFAQLSFVLAGVTTLVGLLGTFRRGKAEANFSLFAVAGIVAGVSIGHVHASPGHVGGRTLRRFPSIESFVLGGSLIVLWAAVALWKEEVWPLRIGAIIGGFQIVWGLAIERFGGTFKAGAGGTDESP